MACAQVLREWQWTKIFIFLKLPDLARVCRVCKFWRQSAVDQLFWNLVDEPIIFAGIEGGHYRDLHTIERHVLDNFHTLLMSPDQTNGKSRQGRFLLCPAPQNEMTCCLLPPGITRVCEISGRYFNGVLEIDDIVIVERYPQKWWRKPYVYLGSTRGRRLDIKGSAVRRVDCRGFEKLGRTLKLIGSRYEGDKLFRIKKSADWCGPPVVSGTQQLGVNLSSWINSRQVFRSIFPLPDISLKSFLRNHNGKNVALPHLVTSSRKLLAFADLVHTDSRADPVYLAHDYTFNPLAPLGSFTPIKIQIRKTLVGGLSYRQRFSVLRDLEAIAQAETSQRQGRVRAMQEEYARQTRFVQQLAKNRTYDHMISEADKAALRQQVVEREAWVRNNPTASAAEIRERGDILQAVLSPMFERSNGILYLPVTVRYS